jgi:hypothetical protein
MAALSSTFYMTRLVNRKERDACSRRNASVISEKARE